MNVYTMRFAVEKKICMGGRDEEFETGRILHFKNFQNRNPKFQNVRVQFAIAAFGFEMQDRPISDLPSVVTIWTSPDPKW